MAATPSEIVQAFGAAIAAGDYQKARGLMRDDMSFRGPIDSFDRADDYIGALQRLGAIVTGTEPERLLADGSEVALFYILKTKVADAPVAERYTVDGERISAVRAYFDARPFGPAPGA